jgi:mannonate dehydratase
MFLIEFLPPRPHQLWALARQMGITHCVVKAAPELTGLPPPDEAGVLARIQHELSGAGLTLLGLEGDPFDMGRIKLGLSGRDVDIARYQAMLREMGRLGIRLLCYNFMAGIGWHRSQAALPGRGGAFVSGFDLSAEPTGLTPAGEVPAERIWENYVYFIRAVLPVAEAAGVSLGAHPDDPPLPALRGIGRVFNSPGQFDRVLALSPSPSHGLTFCQANWKLMCGGNLPALSAAIHKHTAAGRVYFVHLRHVTGHASRFIETFHDEGAGELAAMMLEYHKTGFRGPVRCDHVPTLAGEENAGHAPGYGTLGRLFADGYLLGLMDALGVRTPPDEWPALETQNPPAQPGAIRYDSI